MSFGATDKSLCNKLLTDFDSLMAPGLGAKNEVNKQTNKLKADLHGLVYSPNELLNQALYDFQADVNQNLPGSTVNDLIRIKNFLDNCDYLNRLSPVSAMLGTLFGIYNKIDNLVSDYTNLFPEFGLGNFASGLDGLLKGFNIAGLLSGADSLLDCLDSGCATFDPTYSGNISSMTDQLDGLYNDLNIVSDPLDSRYGMTDFNNIYQDVGMSVSEITQFDNVRSNMDFAKSNATAAVDNAVAAVKNEIKFGSIFA